MKRRKVRIKDTYHLPNYLILFEEQRQMMVVIMNFAWSCETEVTHLCSLTYCKNARISIADCEF